MSASIIMYVPGYAIKRDSTSSICDVDMNGGDSRSGSLSPHGRYMAASGTCCLIGSGGNYVLFDTLGPWEKDMLVDKMASHKIHPDNISYVVCSHSHPDHIGNLNLFRKAVKHFVGTSVYTNDLYDLNCFVQTGSYKYKRHIKEAAWAEEFPEVQVAVHKPYEIDNNLSITPTPGHTMECISMLISNCEKLGKAGLVGDLFENKDDVLNEGIWMGAGSQDPNLQRAHRARMYNECDYIFPGHGEFFQTNNNITL